MEDLAIRLLFVAKFVAYMAAIYLALHMVFARFIRSPESRVLWFFSVVTQPLTRLARPLVGAGAPESRVRLVTLVLFVALYVVLLFVLQAVVGERPRTG